MLHEQYIYSLDLLPAEIHNSKNLTSWNRFSKSIRNSIIKQTLSKSSRQEQLDSYGDTIKLYINLLHMGNAGEQYVLRNCIL